MTKMTRIEALMFALSRPEDATGENGVFARLFRLLASDFAANAGMDATHILQSLRELSKSLSEDPSRHSSSQQELSNVISAWLNPSMPFSRLLQGLGAFGVDEVELTVRAKRHDGVSMERTLCIPTPIVVKNEMVDATEYMIPLRQYLQDAETEPEEETDLSEGELY